MKEKPSTIQQDHLREPEVTTNTGLFTSHMVAGEKTSRILCVMKRMGIPSTVVVDSHLATSFLQLLISCGRFL